MRIEENFKIKRQWYYYLVDLLFDTLQIDNWSISYYNAHNNKIGKVFDDSTLAISLIKQDGNKIIRIIVDVQKTPHVESYMNKTLDGVPELVVVTDSLGKNKYNITKTLSAFILERPKVKDWDWSSYIN